MKYKIFLFVILFVLTGHLIAGSEFTGIFTLINPSATTIAFGNESGTAYIWGNNPLNSWSNPALLAYNDCLSWGWSRDPWFEDIIGGMYVNSSYLSYANQDFGILIPTINASSKFGTTCDYGEQTAYDSNGNLVGTFNSYETCSRFAIAKKLFHYNILRNKGNSDSFTLSAGYDFRYIFSNLCPIVIDSLDREIGHGTMHGLGFLGHYIHNQRLSSKNSFLIFEATAGYYQMNLFKSELSYPSATWPLPYGNRLGVTGKVSYNFENIASIPIPFLQENISICYVYDTQKLGEWESEWSSGFEFGFFNTLFLRWGEYHDEQGHIEGNTSGVGIKLNFNNVVNFEYNYATFPGGELQAEQRKNDLIVSVDLMKVFRKKIR
ncbi:MAG TPA: hypothetical protein ENK03_00735 [Candidatus Cloacimonetes bacterium]|nr:hypothetical protein [Candidatus Cloacimonadota bacterium]